MGLWKVKKIVSNKKVPEKFDVEIAKALNDDWTVIGYSVYDKFHFALLAKKTKGE